VTGVQLYLQKKIVAAMTGGADYGLLAGTRFYDSIYVHEIAAGINNEQAISRQINFDSGTILGEYCWYPPQKKISKEKLFDTKEIQWIKLLLQSKSHSKKLGNCRMKAYLKTLNKNQTKSIIQPVKIIII
jgi:hypothetical protein